MSPFLPSLPHGIANTSSPFVFRRKSGSRTGRNTELFLHQKGNDLPLTFCDVRVASDAKPTQIGLPEVKLGIVPGFGGTQNLTRLVGLPKALELILAGKLLRGTQALRARIIDRLVPATKLLTAANQEIAKLTKKNKKSKTRKLHGMAWWLSHTPMRELAVRAANKKLAKGAARFYPAPKRALQCCVDALRLQEPADVSGGGGAPPALEERG